jgi:hypothetical protein
MARPPILAFLAQIGSGGGAIADGGRLITSAHVHGYGIAPRDSLDRNFYVCTRTLIRRPKITGRLDE